MSLLIPRHLAPFHPKKVPHFFADVLIVGGGLAGLRAALEIEPRLSVLVVTKGSREQSNSVQAQGGIAAVLAPDDMFEQHVADTLEAGGPLCDGRRLGVHLGWIGLDHRVSSTSCSALPA